MTKRWLILSYPHPRDSGRSLGRFLESRSGRGSDFYVMGKKGWGGLVWELQVVSSYWLRRWFSPDLTWPDPTRCARKIKRWLGELLAIWIEEAWETMTSDFLAYLFHWITSKPNASLICWPTHKLQTDKNMICSDNYRCPINLFYFLRITPSRTLR